MGIMDKLQKNSRIKETDTLDKSKIFSNQEMVPTKVPMINVALSGDPDGGLTAGLTIIWVGKVSVIQLALSIAVKSAVFTVIVGTAAPVYSGVHEGIKPLPVPSS